MPSIVDVEKILALYAEFEPMLEALAPIKYKNVLRGVVQNDRPIALWASRMTIP